jgi:3-oxoacyl-[acyl-carrier protein] reductase
LSKPERARELVLAVEAAGGRAVALHADSADAAALERAIDEGAQNLGGLDVLVNNAGILIVGPVDTFTVRTSHAIESWAPASSRMCACSATVADSPAY